MNQSNKKRITPFNGPMETWWDYLVYNEHFTVDEIRAANVNSQLQIMTVPNKNLYNWTTKDDVKFIITVFHNHSMEYLQQKFNCSEFCIWKTIKRIFGTLNLSEIRRWSKKRRRALLHCYIEKDDLHEIESMLKELRVEVL
jgi:hypothetical protein